MTTIRTICLLLVTSLGLMPVADALRADDWPCFLGPHHTGVSDETGLLDAWPATGPPLVWQMKTGTGYTAPSVVGDRLVLFHRVDSRQVNNDRQKGDREVIACLDAKTGQELWTHGYPTTYSDPYGYNDGPRCTPLLHDGHCYTLGAEGILLCLRLDDGKQVWQRDLEEEYEIPKGFFGIGPTPIMEDGKLIVLVGGQPNAGVVAFDPATGKTLWEAVGKQTWDGAETGWTTKSEYHWTGEESLVSYASPIAAAIHGKRHLLCLMRQGLVSLDPSTGEENFHFWFRSRTHESVNAARPVVMDDTVLLSSPYRTGAARLRINEDGKSCEELWFTHEKLETHWSTAIAHEGHYYGFTGRHEQEGALRCIDAKTGDVVWSSDGYGKPLETLGLNRLGQIVDRASGKVIPRPFYGRGSMILADGRFIVLSESGFVALVEATSTGWKEISRFHPQAMHAPSWTAPVLADGLLYLRCEDALVCFDLRNDR